MGDDEQLGVRRRTCGTWEYRLRFLQTNPPYCQEYLRNQAFVNNDLRRNLDAGLRLSVVTIQWWFRSFTIHPVKTSLIRSFKAKSMCSTKTTGCSIRTPRAL